MNSINKLQINTADRINLTSLNFNYSHKIKKQTISQKQKPIKLQRITTANNYCAVTETN